MIDRPRVGISSVGDSPLIATLKVGGVDVSGITHGLRLELDAHSEHRMTVDLRAFPVDAALNGVHVVVEKDIHDFLVRLGWTPPPEEATNAIH